MRLLLSVLGILCIGMMQAQVSIEKQVVTNGGTHGSNGDLSIEWTVGQMSSTELTNGDLTLTQGFHQGASVVTGLENNELDIDLLVYPNPSSDYFRLEFPSEINESYQLDLIDQTGMTVETRSLNNQSQQRVVFSIAHLAAGQYIVRLTTADGNQSNSWLVIKSD